MKFMTALELSPRSVTVVCDRLETNGARNIGSAQRFASTTSVLDYLRFIKPHGQFPVYALGIPIGKTLFASTMIRESQNN